MRYSLRKPFFTANFFIFYFSFSICLNVKKTVSNYNGGKNFIPVFTPSKTWAISPTRRENKLRTESIAIVSLMRMAIMRECAQIYHHVWYGHDTHINTYTRALAISQPNILGRKERVRWRPWNGVFSQENEKKTHSMSK